MTGEAVPLIDPAHVAELIALDGGNGALFARFVDLFVARTPQRVAEMNACAGAGNLASLAEAAHSLRGAAGNLGAFRLALLLGRIEAAGKTGDISAARDQLALLDAEYDATRAALIAAAQNLRT